MIMQLLGVCVGIILFNFLVMILLWMFLMVIVIGNIFIFKLFEQDLMVIMCLVELVLEVGILKGVLNVVYGGEDVVNVICDYLDIKVVLFVGFICVGIYVYNCVLLVGKCVQCMMGVKNYVVVLLDVNKEQIFNVMVGVVFGVVGQCCMVVFILVLVGEVCNWVQDLVEKVKMLKVSVGIVFGIDVGLVIFCSVCECVEGLIVLGVEQGVKLVFDGCKLQVDGFEKGNFVGLIIFVGVIIDMCIYQEEIFGLVLVIFEVEMLEDVIVMVNSNLNGNGIVLFIQFGVVVCKFQEDIDVGQVGINVLILVLVLLFLFIGLCVFKLGDLGLYGKQVVLFYIQIKMVIVCWFDDEMLSYGVNIMISLK